MRRVASGPLDVAHRQPEDDPLPKSTLSRPLMVLRLAGAVHNEPNGRQRTITLRKSDLGHRFPGLLAAVLHQPDQRCERALGWCQAHECPRT